LRAGAAGDGGGDHRRLDVFVAEELLHGADVVAALQEVGAKEWRKGGGLAFLVRLARFIARFVAFCTADLERWCRRSVPLRGSRERCSEGKTDFPLHARAAPGYLRSSASGR
jgi:hypothetical protein